MNLFFNITQRLEPFFLIIWPSRIEPFLKNMTQRIELFKCDLERRIILQLNSNNWIWLKAWNPPVQYDSKNWTFFSQMTRRLDFSFSNMSDRKLFFWKKDDSKNWFSENINQIIQTLFWWLKELSSFLNMTQRIEKFHDFFDSKNWTYFEYDSKIWTFSWMWLTELNFFIDSKKWVLFFRMTKILLNTTQRIEPLFEYVSKNWTFSGISLNGLNTLHKRTQRIGPWKIIWTTKPSYELGIYLTQRIEFFLKNITQKLLTFFDMTHRIELLFRTWLTELNFFFLEYDSLRLNPSFLLESKKMTPFLAWLKENFFSHIRLKEQWSFLWKYWPKDLIFVNRNISLRIELFLKALTTNPFSQIWFILRIQSFWTFFNMTHRIGSKNWTLLFNMTQRKMSLF